MEAPLRGPCATTCGAQVQRSRRCGQQRKQRQLPLHLDDLQCCSCGVMLCASSSPALTPRNHPNCTQTLKSQTVDIQKAGNVGGSRPEFWTQLTILRLFLTKLSHSRHVRGPRIADVSTPSSPSKERLSANPASLTWQLVGFTHASLQVRAESGSLFSLGLLQPLAAQGRILAHFLQSALSMGFLLGVESRTRS